MEIEIGEYVRTKKGEIAKIIDIVKPINANILLFDVNLKEIWLNEVGLNIKNHSKDITDLIEKDDYVNGYRVVEIMEDIKTGEIHLEMTSDYTNQEIGDCTIYNKDIKSIVTKEAFKNIEYRLE